MWEGEFDEFIYIDTDSVVLDNVDFAFEYLSSYDFVAGHSNIDSTIQWVWKDSIYTTRKLTDEQIKYAANTGLLVSRKSALDIRTAEKKSAEGVELAPHMELYCMEQPFLNYLIVTSGRPYSSILTLTRDVADVWAGTKGGQIKDGKIFFKNRFRPGPVFLEWSGEWQPRRFDRYLYRLLRLLRIKSEDEEPIPRFFMPYRILWKHYRYLR